MMILPRGITGFRDAGEPPLPDVDAGAFKAACYEAARRLGGSVLATRPAGHAANFHAADMALADQQVIVLCNAHFPLIGLTEPITLGQQVFHFVDVPALAESLSSQAALRSSRRPNLRQAQPVARADSHSAITIGLAQ